MTGTGFTSATILLIIAGIALVGGVLLVIRLMNHMGRMNARTTIITAVCASLLFVATTLAGATGLTLLILGIVA